jgi:hypothetical protein
MKVIVRMFVFLALPTIGLADPQLASWFTVHSDQPARIYRSDADRVAGESEMTWSNGRQTQAQPTRTGVQQIYYSANWIYIRSTGLPSQIMGPWYMDPQHYRAFPNLPMSQNLLLALPRHPMVATSGGEEPHGEIGITVDGVRFFDDTDSFSYSHEHGMDASPRARIGQGDQIWNRDAMVNEGQTFDPGMGHQENWGHYHYHAEAIALRYELGDHVDFDTAAKTYRESAGEPVRHSPIIAWLYDGYPVYGPYGYANPTNPASGLRRMTSGYVLRNGEKGTDNLADTGRRTLPAWQARVADRSADLAADETGPAVSTRYPLGHYLQDYAYRGDLGQVAGRDFDLDEHNGRWCVTPEFPQGTYAYFTTIDANGQPVGQTLRRFAEPVTTYFNSITGATENAAAAVPGTATTSLVWHSENGGDYQPGSSHP